MSARGLILGARAAILAAATFGGAVSSLGCAAAPRPPILDEVQRARATPKASAAAELAPQAFLHAEALHREAERAAGDAASARVLAEHALVAYEHAFVLTRLARADARRSQAEGELTALSRSLDDLDAQQAQVAAEADDLEMRLRVARDALPIAPVGPASAERERARQEAARSLALQARLLCVAAGLLSPEDEALAEKTKALDALDAALDASARPVPIADATRLRSQCLEALTHARRPHVRAAPEVSRADALLEELSRAGLEPFRDDRGVVVVLKAPFAGSRLRTEGEARVRELGELARARTDTPILVVAHRAQGAATADDRSRLSHALSLLEASGAGHVAGALAGDAQPRLPRSARHAAAQNERLEIVFVTPSH
jgi:hypothetical protein